VRDRQVEPESVIAGERRKYYLSKALEADEKAAKCVDDAARQAWQDIAGSWRSLADRITRDLKL